MVIAVIKNTTKQSSKYEKLTAKITGLSRDCIKNEKKSMFLSYNSILGTLIIGASFLSEMTFPFFAHDLTQDCCLTAISRWKVSEKRNLCLLF